MSARVYTIQDVLRGLQRQLDALQNPATSVAVIIDQLSSADETIGNTDAVAALTSAASAPAWGSEKWNETTWG